MRSSLVVLSPPALDDPRFLDAPEHLFLQAFIAKLPDEALRVPVLPRIPGLNVHRARLLALPDTPDPFGIHPMPLAPQQCRDASVAIASMLSGQTPHGSPQPSLVRGTWLEGVQKLERASPSTRQAMRVETPGHCSYCTMTRRSRTATLCLRGAPAGPGWPRLAPPPSV
jgi:hypothetical protein